MYPKFKKMNQSYSKTILVFSILLALLILAQLTRFENKLVLSYDGENLKASIYKNAIEHNIPKARFDEMTATFQKSMVAENGIRSLVIYDETGQRVFSEKHFIIYLFGKDIIGTMIKGNYPSFRKTFGDWSMDRFMSNEVYLYNDSLPEKFKIEATFLGRGYASLSLKGKENLQFNIADGFLDNVAGFCEAKGCFFMQAESNESLLRNAFRISNFFIEGAMLSLVIVILVSLFSGTAKRGLEEK